MVCLGLEPRVARWKAQTNPLSYGGTPINCFVCKLNLFICIFSKNFDFCSTRRLLVLYLFQSLMVMERYSLVNGRGFKSHLDDHFFTFICCKLV